MVAMLFLVPGSRFRVLILVPGSWFSFLVLVPVPGSSAEPGTRTRNQNPEPGTDQNPEPGTRNLLKHLSRASEHRLPYEWQRQRSELNERVVKLLQRVLG